MNQFLLSAISTGSGGSIEVAAAGSISTLCNSFEAIRDAPGGDIHALHIFMRLINMTRQLVHAFPKALKIFAKMF
ncbi:MAG: hypothetical protein HYX63_07510 [Gammaproteobacteria bacterium]|nr:hypothetical protein [Gammaproteobacteria bacterium]